MKLLSKIDVLEIAACLFGFALALFLFAAIANFAMLTADCR